MVFKKVYYFLTKFVFSSVIKHKANLCFLYLRIYTYNVIFYSMNMIYIKFSFSIQKVDGTWPWCYISCILPYSFSPNILFSYENKYFQLAALINKRIISFFLPPRYFFFSFIFFSFHLKEILKWKIAMTALNLQHDYIYSSFIRYLPENECLI